MLNKKQVEDSEWAMEFLMGNSLQYNTALAFVLDPDLKVTIVYSTEMGDGCWAIVPIADSTFWLDAFPTKEQAEVLCRLMEWPIHKQSD